MIPPLFPPRGDEGGKRSSILYSLFFILPAKCLSYNLTMLDTRGLVLGELAVRDHLISRDQLEDVVDVQEKGGFSQPLGSLMLERKLLTRPQLDGLLLRQKQVLQE